MSKERLIIIIAGRVKIDILINLFKIGSAHNLTSKVVDTKVIASILIITYLYFIVYTYIDYYSKIAINIIIVY